ncbi:MAG: hypothetical protein IKY18_07725 [Oscillospiraceae bacterium]|nr:hypothetical protein [Oscillospiraceae bacterium]
MKALNVFAIILAWFLSIAMVVMLIAAPLALSALSLLDTENIVEIVSQTLLESNKSAAAQPQEEFVIQNLSAETEAVTEEKPENAAGSINMDGLQGLLGSAVGSEEMLNKVLTSDAMSELLGAYTKDITNAFAGKNTEKEFTPEFLVEVVQENLDEIVEIVAESGTPLTNEEKQEFKNQLQTTVEEKAEEIVAALPAPEEIKESIVKENEDIELAFTILAKKDTIKGAIVGVIVLISALIFGLRYPGLRGMRWLSTNLFTAGGFNLFVCTALGMGSTALKGVTAGMNAIDGAGVDGIFATLLSQLSTGVVIRTVIIFVAAIALLVGYIFLKPFVRKKKVAKDTEPAVEEVVSETVPAFEPAPVAVEQEAVAKETAEIQETAAEEPAEEPAPAEEV